MGLDHLESFFMFLCSGKRPASLRVVLSSGSVVPPTTVRVVQSRAAICYMSGFLTYWKGVQRVQISHWLIERYRFPEKDVAGKEVGRSEPVLCIFHISQSTPEFSRMGACRCLTKSHWSFVLSQGKTLRYRI